MSYKDYLKDHWMPMCAGTALLILLILFGRLTEIPVYFLVMTGLSIFLTGLGIHFWDYGRKKGFYNQIREKTRDLDQAYLLAEILEEPEFLEGKLACKAMREMGRSMAEQVSSCQQKQKEYKEYIELWVHEIKLPIATGKLLVENNRQFYDERMAEELDKIDAYAEQALFYARSSYVEKDYVLKKIFLRQVTAEVLKKNRKILLEEKISIQCHDLEETVYSDSKWLAFILQQILSNSVKYMGEGERVLEWYAKKEREQVKLYLRDTGMGISARDLPRVWEKGFTGENGRLGKKSTGIGLYLCKKLCEKMGHRIEIVSAQGKGCLVVIRFPAGSMTEEIFSGEEIREERLQK